MISSNIRLARSIISMCPLVTGSKLPEHTALRIMAPPYAVNLKHVQLYMFRRCFIKPFHTYAELPIISIAPTTAIQALFRKKLSTVSPYCWIRKISYPSGTAPTISSCIECSAISQPLSAKSGHLTSFARIF